MPATPPQMINVRCPACGTPYTAEVYNVIDVRQEPRLKRLFLQGRLNVGICPQCGAAGALSAPLVYHDPQKELLFCLVPQELRMSENERQRTIGEMSNAIINNLPAEERKGYLLRPRIFLTLQTMVESVLEADGISKEMLQSQQEKARIINQLLQSVDDPLQLSSLIGQYSARIDDEFFSLLTANMRIAQQGRQTELLERFGRLREMLLERTSAGQELAKQEQALQAAIAGIDEEMSREDLLDRIATVKDEHPDQVLSVLIALARPLVDYQFFQLLTSRIDKAEQENDRDTVARLKTVREKVLDLTQKLDAEMREQMQQKAQLLAAIIQSEDQHATIEANLDEIDSAFMSVLETNILQNEQMGRQEVAQALRSIQNLILHVMQEDAPPEIQLINHLLQVEYPEGTRQVLSENKELISEELISVMELLAQDFGERGDEEVSRQLTNIRAQALLMLQQA